VYSDLDGTLLGPGGSLFATPRGTSADGARAVAALHEAGVELVLISGRIRSQTRELARLLGASAYACEMGGVLCFRDGRDKRVLRLDAVDGEPPHDAIVRSGAAGVLLERFQGRLEPHSPWSALPRETSILFRGLVDPAVADRVLASSGYGWLRVQDNGILSGGPQRWPHLRLPQVRAYHLIPAGIGKDVAVARHR